MARGGARRGSGRPSKAPNKAQKGQKWCPYGEHFTLLSNFGADHSKKKGLQTYCRACQIKYFKKHGGVKRKYRNLRRRITKALGGECAECGAIESLHIDHLDPEQGYTHRKLGWSNPRIYRFALKHLEHFQLLCIKHHYRKHKRRPKY